MTPREYWDSLCKTDGGEFIKKRVRDVSGFLTARPRGPESSLAMNDPFVIEDAYGLLETQFGGDAERPGKFFFTLQHSTYQFIEVGTPRSPGWLNHYVIPDRLQALRESPARKWSERDFTGVADVANPQSRYAVTWYGIRRERDRELGISGGELVVFDLTTGEVLAVRRGYALDAFAARGILTRKSWLSSLGCPVMARDSESLRHFIEKVLIPPSRS
jgi:hypothetical protein